MSLKDSLSIFKRKITLIIQHFLLSIRELFISEKQRYVSSRTLENINLNFKNLSPYSEINNLRIMSILFFGSIFFMIVFYYTYIDIRTNLIRNDILLENAPMEIIIDNPMVLNNNSNSEIIEYTIKKDDTILGILTDKINLNYQEAYNCISSLQKVINLKNLKIGQKIFFKVKNNITEDTSGNIRLYNTLLELRLTNDALLKNILIYKDSSNNFISTSENIQQITLYNKYVVFIRNGLYIDAINSGIPVEIVMTLINYYSFDIDFQRDLKAGDMLEVVFEAKYTIGGKKISNGNIVFANLKTNNKNYNIYRHTNANNNDKFIGYFDENGLSTQKSLLKTPINGARISSGFTTRRKHPVLGYTRAHKGVDFAASTGTPIYAAGSGKITKIVTNCQVGARRCGGGFGNYILLQHTSNYSTEYAHLSRLASTVRVGVSVKQGEIIGYVGATGLASGPHLHYGIIHNGERINPTLFKTLPTVKLKGEELLSFFKQRDKIDLLRKVATNQNSGV